MSTAIFFDLDGTLIEFSVPYARVLEATFEARVGRSSDRMLDTYNDAFLDAFGALDPDPYERGMEAAVEACDLDASPARLVGELLEREVEYATVTDGADRLLDALGERRTLGVLSNGTPDWQAAKLEALGLDAHFDAVLTSYDVGAHKPDPAAFDAAREAIAADRYVMVGDDREDDVAGAREAGFDAAVHRDPSSDVPVRVDDLGSLADAIRL